MIAEHLFVLGELVFGRHDISALSLTEWSLGTGLSEAMQPLPFPVLVMRWWLSWALDLSRLAPRLQVSGRLPRWRLHGVCAACGMDVKITRSFFAYSQPTSKHSRAILMSAGAFSYRSSSASAVSGREHGPLEQIKAVIFDMDGTLTVPVLNFLEMRSRLGLRPEQDILPTIQALPPPERERAMAVIEELEEEGVRKMEVQPGALALLAFIAEAGVERALMTRNSNAATQVSHPLQTKEGRREGQRASLSCLTNFNLMPSPPPFVGWAGV